MTVESPCACGSSEFRFTEGLPAREKTGFRAVCVGCFADLGWEATEETEEEG